MTFKIFISSAIVSAVISVLGSIITAKITQKAAIDAAKATASHELDKMERIWQHDSIVSSDEEFAQMASVVSKFIAYANGTWSIDALEMVAAIRSKESGQIGTIMDNLYVSIMNDQYDQADSLLTQSIDEKRRIKSTGTKC